MLTKGPVALVAIGLPLLAWRRLDIASTSARATRGAVTAALALAVLPVTLWAVLAALREPVLWRALFFGQHIERAALGTAHAGPPWEHLVELPWLLLPWTPLAVLGLADGWSAWRARQRREPHSAELLFVAWWFVSLFLFFSAIPAKREVYLLPAFPACALLAAHGLARRIDGDFRARWAGRAVTAGLVLVGVALVSSTAVFALAAHPLFSSTGVARLLRSAAENHPALELRPSISALPFLAGALIAHRAFGRGDVAKWASAVCASWTVGLMVAVVFLAPAVDLEKSDRALAARLARLPQRPTRILCIGLRPDGLRFYGGGPCVESKGTPAEMRAAFEREGAQFLAVMTSYRHAQLSPESKRQLRVLDAADQSLERVVVVGGR
jgi:hypothetical protein